MKNIQTIIETSVIQEEIGIKTEIHAIEVITAAVEATQGIKAEVIQDIVVQAGEINIAAITDIETRISTEIIADIEAELGVDQVDQHIPEDPNRVTKRSIEMEKSMVEINIKNHGIRIKVEIITITMESTIREMIIITDGNVESVATDIKKVPHAPLHKEQRINTMSEDQKEISM